MIGPTYPVQFSVDYPGRPLDRLTTGFRIFVAIPIAIVLGTVDGATWQGGGRGGANAALERGEADRGGLQRRTRRVLRETGGSWLDRPHRPASRVAKFTQTVPWTWASQRLKRDPKPSFTMAVRSSRSARGCGKTLEFNLRVESPFRFRQSENQ